MSCVDDDAVIWVGVGIVQLSAQNSLIVDKTKIELDSHADTFIVGDHCLVLDDNTIVQSYNRPDNVF